MDCQLEEVLSRLSCHSNSELCHGSFGPPLWYRLDLLFLTVLRDYPTTPNY